MYGIISLILSFIIAFALSNIFNFAIVFLISFVASFCLLTCIDTIVEGDNASFKLACKAISSGEFWGATWWLDLLPLWVFLIFGIIGAIVTAPLWYFLSNTKPTSIKNVVSTLIILSLSFLLIYGVILLISPLTAYKLLHYGWVIGLFIGIPIVSLIATIIMKSNQLITGKTTALFSVWSILLIPIMIIGVVTSMNATYRISTAEDMKAFGNAPTNYDTVFILENDIDFKGKDVGWFGGQKDFKGVFDGQGYTLYNIELNAKCKKLSDGSREPQGLGFVRENSGIIKNVNFRDCKFSIQPKHSSIINFDMYFGVLAAENSSGKIYNCDIIDCQARYTISSQVSAHMSLSIGSGNGEREDINIINNYIDETFYVDEDIEWKKVG